MKIGIDFGTTHTTAAALIDGEIKFVKLDTPDNLLRSMIYISRENHEVTLGRKAVERYLEENTGRIIVTREKVVGVVENWVAQMTRGPLEPDGPIQLIYDVIIDEDISSPGRLIQSIKTGLRQEDYKGTKVFDKYFSIEDLIALILKHVKDSAETQFNQKITHVAMGRPVKFSEDPEVDAAAQSKLNTAAEQAGFENISYVAEPLAAARFYIHNIEKEETVMVFDFGGGTLDLSILRAGPDQPHEVLGTHGVLVGGDDFDSAIMESKIADYFGKHAKLKPNNTPITHRVFELLGQWQTIPLLSRSDTMPLIRNAQEKSDMPDSFRDLEKLVLNNYGFALFVAIEQAKRRISRHINTLISMRQPELTVEVPIRRPEFQRIISNYLGDVQIGLNEVLKKANLTPEDIDVVITTGGSSLVPIFNTMLERKFEDANIIHSDTFGSVGAGLAIAAADM